MVKVKYTWVYTRVYYSAFNFRSIEFFAKKFCFIFFVLFESQQYVFKRIMFKIIGLQRSSQIKTYNV